MQTSVPQALPWTDPQMEIMGNLALLQSIRTRKDPLSDHERSMEFPKGAHDKMLRLLNWLATAFVRENRGDAVAAALATTRGAVTLYLAANRGLPEPADRDFALRFLEELRTSMRQFHDNQPNSMASLVDCVMEFTKGRFLRKLETVGDMKPLSGRAASACFSAEVQFEALVKKRVGTVQEDKDFFTTARGIFPDHPQRPTSDTDGSATLIFLFNQLHSSLIQKTKKPGTLYLGGTSQGSDALRFSTQARVVVCTNFFKEIGEPTVLAHFTWEEVLWLRKLKRRLWRVARYADDALLLESVAFPKLAKLLGDNLPRFLETGQGFDIVWVADNSTTLPAAWPTYLWPNPPDERLRQLLEQYNLSDDLLEDLCGDADSDKDMRNVWHANVAPRLHCEIQLVEYLAQHRIPVMDDKIGVSKLMCFPCGEYFNAVLRSQTPGHPAWSLSGCSRKFYAGWLIPHGPPGNEVVQFIREKVKTDLKALSEQAVRKRSNSGGSDTSGGSRSGDERGPKFLELFYR